MHPLDWIKSSKFIAMWRGLTSQQRMLAGGATLLLLVAVGGVLHWAFRDEYVALSSSLELSQVESVTATLREAGVSYRLAGGGTTILVPERDLARARVRIAAEGLPSKGQPGFELFDVQDWSATNFSEQVKYQRALKGELERTIAEFSGVREATVNFIVPKQSPFRQERRDAEASVLLKLQPGRTLPKETVQAIVYLVSSSIEWLSPEKVTVLDDAGRVLSAPSDDSSVAFGGRQLELQREVERYLEEKVASLLSSVVGASNVRVAASVRLNFDQIERAIEQAQFTSDDTTPQNAAMPATTSPTTAGPAPAGAATTTATGAASEARSSNNSHRIERVRTAIGSVERLFVSVLVNDRVILADNGPAFEPRSPSELANIEAIVRNAVGALDERGDRVTVNNIRFEGDPLLQGMDRRALYDVFEPWIRPILMLLTIVFLFFFAQKSMTILQQKRSVPEEDRSVATENPETHAERSTVAEPDDHRIIIPPTVVLEIEEPAIVKETEGLVGRNPELAARLFRSLLREG